MTKRQDYYEQINAFSRHKNTEKGGFHAALFPSLGALASLEKSPLIFPGNQNNANDISRFIRDKAKGGPERILAIFSAGYYERRILFKKLKKQFCKI